jgi:hypothetical protein
VNLEAELVEEKTFAHNGDHHLGEMGRLGGVLRGKKLQ